MKLEKFDLHNETLNALHNHKQFKVNDSQKAIVEAIAKERDLIIKNGENKEELDVFGVAVLEVLNKTEEQEGTISLILSNSDENLKTVKNQVIALQSGADCMLITTDGDENKQRKELENGNPIVLANPARLEEILQKNRHIFRHLKLLVIDRFDEMVSSGQVDALNNVKKRILNDSVTVISTGEYSGETKKTALNLVDEPTIRGFGPLPRRAFPII